MEREQVPAEAGGDRRLRRNPTIVAAVIGLIGTVSVTIINQINEWRQQKPEIPSTSERTPTPRRSVITSPGEAVGGATPNGDAQSPEGTRTTCPEGPVGGGTPNEDAPPSEERQITGPKITCPIEGDKVGHELTVQGTASVEDEGHLVVIVYKNSNQRYYPRNGQFEWVSKTEGTWKWTISIGSKDNRTGHLYEVRLLKLPDGVCREIEDFLKAQNAGQKPDGLKDPPCGAQIVHSVGVVRR